MDLLIKYLAAFLGGGGLVLVLIFLNPEKAEIWASKFWRLVRFIWKGAEKKYIAHDIQGHVNDFNKKLVGEIHNYESTAIKIKWIEQEETESSFLKDNALIIRLRKSEDQNKNFVLATMTFISQVVLKKAKRYISPTQKESIDLYVAKKFFDKEKPGIVDQFLEDFLIPKTEGSKKVSEYFDKYSLIDKVGLFLPVFIQELNYLGNKVFGKKREDVIVSEVNGLIDFLKDYSERELGQEKSYMFNGRYCRFGVMIVAKSWKVLVGNINPYLKYAEKLLKVGIENIYLIGPSRRANFDFMKVICSHAEKKFNVECLFEKIYIAYIKVKGKRERRDNLLFLLRSKDLKYHYDSEDQSSI
ncbi:MAG: hypothetical protein KKC39_02845 [Candidatus Omnitrophica bacterium]|nr:hypothetical protein [Candidatus Omnitrophota bacterium]MBU4467668.1 hypothetical protein [Candidatus Omnitrophota bacterium]MCG2707492.1 hypothetical protein [Candidatus Omnitrophota bacterium]